MPDYDQIISKDRAERLIAIMEATPVLKGNMLTELGFWPWLCMTLWMIFHPHEAARFAGRGVKEELIEIVRKELED